MDTVLAILVLLCWISAPLAVALPALRRGVALGLPAVAVVALAAALLGPAERSLVVRHTFAGYAATELEPSPVHYAVDQVTAPGWLWPLPLLGYLLPLAAGLWLARRRGAPANAFLLPMALAWGGAACLLLLQKAAAPEAIVQPFALERVLFPAGLALALLLAAQRSGFWPLLARLSVGLVAMRLPVALFSKLASDQAWGTSLDVHTITDFVNPLTRLQIATEPGSTEQQLWLIWSQHLLIVPGLYMLSLGGVAIGLHLFHQHGTSAR